MRFNSVQFLVFFPVVSMLYWLIPHKWRWMLLLAGSYLFYMTWNPMHIIVLLVVTAVGYGVGLGLTMDIDPKKRRLLLLLSVAAILGILFYFKLSGRSNDFLLALFSPQSGRDEVFNIRALQPLGISFFTLQAISYIIDIYRGLYRPERHTGIFALFMAFFAQLTAGPIARANHLIPQFYEPQGADYEKIVTGLQRMAWGFFKKLVVADRLALLINPVWDQPSSYTGIVLILATYAFAFQIYCDFSAYADIAIGAARVLGFQLQENFQRPYYAQSIVDFWRRWHISLYNWLRDYVFYPTSRALQRTRLPFRHILVIILPPVVTMLISGLWHGTNWNFLIWGGLHGLFIVMSVLMTRWRSHLHLPLILPSRITTALKIFGTFSLVSFTWIFFRANTLSDALYIIRHLFAIPEIPSSLSEILPGGRYEWMIAFLALLLIERVHWIQERSGSIRAAMQRQPAWLRWSAYYALIMIILMFGKFESTEFIYAGF